MNFLLADPITVDRATILVPHPNELSDNIRHRGGQTFSAEIFHHCRNAI
jgi:hypothetical protein